MEDVKILAATQSGASANLASGIIAASGRPWSIAEAMELHSSIHCAMFPNPGHGRYDSWKADPTQLTRIWK